jgi:Xaa-Pro aminopeptidase
MSLSWLFLALALQIAGSEYEGRRARLMSEFSDGILLLHARTAPSSLGEAAFKQDANFLYFTGLADQPAAILALDGPRKEAILFVPPAPSLFGAPVEGVSLAPGSDSAAKHGFSRVEAWERFVPFIEKRISEGARKLYLDEARHAEFPGAPEPMWPVAGEKLLWSRSVKAAFPAAEIASAEKTIREMRWVKSKGEIEILREVARTSASALLAGLRAVEPGVSQRVSEVAIVSGCIEAGAKAPSFWPWTMSGPNAHLGQVVRSFYDYDHLDRAMKSGELVRMDVGCALRLYEGDVGRTIPVSGQFTPEQREAWELLIRGYRAGLSAMKAGATLRSVMERARAEVERAQSSLQSDYARKAAAAILNGPLEGRWHIHGVGIDGGETGTDRLEAGSVIAFEPMFSVEADAYYLEDMILVTESGHEVLTKGLPYSASEIEEAMAGARR